MVNGEKTKVMKNAFKFINGNGCKKFEVINNCVNTNIFGLRHKSR